LQPFDNRAWGVGWGRLSVLNDQPTLILGQGLPSVGEELSQAIDRVAHDPAEHIIEVLPGIHPARLAGMQETEEESSRPRPTLACRKEPVLPPQGKGTDGVLRGVVVRLQPPVIEEAMVLVAIEKIPDLAMVAPSGSGGRRNYARSHLLKGEVGRDISPMFRPSLVRSCYFLLR
jgi:hypothetical protein